MDSAYSRPFLQAVGLSKRYGGVEALQQVDLSIYPGDVIGLVGDTNSGKSTLLRLIAGGLQPDGGMFYVQGKAARLYPAHRAARYGIQAVYQDINNAEHMSGLGYIFGGQSIRRRGPLRWLGVWNQSRLAERAAAEFERLGFDVPPLMCRLHDLTSTQRKLVALVHATIARPRLLLLDEPVDALEAYKENLFRLIANMRKQGGAVLLVTQNLDDIFRVATRLVVLNAGEKIAERQAGDATEEEIVRLILGSVQDRLTPAVWALSNYFVVRRQAEELDRLNKQLAHRAVQLQAHADVARSATSILDLDQLLVQSAEIISQRFHYYHTAIFLADERVQEAVLRSSASSRQPPPEVAPIRLALDDHSMVGWCIANGQPCLANDVAESSLYLSQPELPDTRAELVLPLRIGKRVLGALDLQSDRVQAFGDDDVPALQGLADQLAIAIRNAELFDAAQQARRQADQANRFKSIFLSNMSHELRTPLSAIIGHTQAMLAANGTFYRTPLADEYRADLETIRKSGEHLLALINDILDLSRIEAGEMTLHPAPISLKSIFDYALHTTGALLHARPVRLESAYPDVLPPVWADHMRTQQVVLNLLSNAAKFTESGTIRLSAQVAGDDVIVAVADTGIGIPDHMRDQIFDRFSQGDATIAKKYSGTGLGLSISRQFVELQGGRMWFESEVDRGTTFYFSVPVATTQQLALAGGQVVTSPFVETKRGVVFHASQNPIPSPDTCLVLLAKPECSDAFLFQKVLEDAGYVVEMAAVSDLLLEMAELMLPDLIVFDAGAAQGAEILDRLLHAPYTGDIPLLVLHPPGMVIPSEGPPFRQAPLHRLACPDATPERLVQAVRACVRGGQ